MHALVDGEGEGEGEGEGKAIGTGTTLMDNRRSFMNKLMVMGGGVGSGAMMNMNPSWSEAAAMDDDSNSNSNNDLVDVYFGVGCYWHIQHEFVEAERTLLNRSDSQLTSRTGYAGGTATDKEGRVSTVEYSRSCL